ncbi:MAG: LPS assembly lipoprotein LptE [Deltaproteobacteria bacterium]|nr:LPS assembly lipoprotein LptE [Deltaproteobacteria bacterium]
MRRASPLPAPRLARAPLRGLAVVLLAALAGCSGYHVVGARTGLGDVRRVAVEPLANRSYEPGIERMVTAALVREFQRRGGASVVRDPAGADLVLSGAVEPVLTRSRSFSSVELALEFEVELAVELVARRADGSEVAIDGSVLRDWELYLASADIEVERKNRDEALRRLSALLATRVHDALSERLAAEP